MKKWLMCASIIGMIGLSCVKPGHDNEYDPKNPDKALLRGDVYIFDTKPLKDAYIAMVQDSAIMYETYSTSDGKFEFSEVDPGIYDVVADAKHFMQQEFYAESLPAGSVVEDFGIFFNTLNFEDDPVGSTQAYGMTVKDGRWEIVEDFSEPENRSAPNAYQGTWIMGLAELAGILFNDQVRDFFIETYFNVKAGTNWGVGMVLRYKEADTLGYMVMVTADDSLRLYQADGDSTYLLATTEVTVGKDAWYCLAAECDGPSIKIFFEGDEKFAVTANMMDIGDLGIWASGEGVHDTVIVNFDDVGIWVY